jgi:hypothetical protein
MRRALVKGKGTKSDNMLGPHGESRGGSGGKGDMISGTFGESWLQNINERLNKRCLPCSKCGIAKPEGPCANIECGHVPDGNRGW